MVSSQLKKLIEQETRGEDIPQGQCADTPEICLPVTFVTLFSVKKQNFWPWNYILQMKDCQDFQSLDVK